MSYKLPPGCVSTVNALDASAITKNYNTGRNEILAGDEATPVFQKFYKLRYRRNDGIISESVGGLTLKAARVLAYRNRHLNPLIIED